MIEERIATTADLRPRPWGEPTPEELEEHGPYAEYRRWERWMYILNDVHLEGFGEDGILETLNLTQAAHLYNLMGRLADGMEARP